MATNQTIDGVPRELIEKAMLACFEAGFGIPHAELRALLDAPIDPASALNRAWQAGYDTGYYAKNPAHERAAAQPHGEPLVFVEASELRNLKVSGFESFSALLYRDQASMLCPQRVALYAEQPAPVAVVLPERRDFSPQSDSEWGWNACLDEVARLTATVRIPERLVMTDGLHTYEYVTGHNAAIDKMLGVKS